MARFNNPMEEHVGNARSDHLSIFLYWDYRVGRKRRGRKKEFRFENMGVGMRGAQLL